MVIVTLTPPTKEKQTTTGKSTIVTQHDPPTVKLRDAQQLAAQEREPGVWTMVAQYERTYGTVRFIRRGDELGYRVEDVHGNTIGYYRTLIAATFAAHAHYLSTLAPGGAIKGQSV